MNHICPTCLQMLPPGMDLHVSLDENCVIWKGIVCHLTRTETEIMTVLASGTETEWKHADRIIQGVYGGGDGPIDADQALRVFMRQIRHKLRDSQIPIVIENSRSRTGDTRQYRLKYGFD